MLGGIPVKTRYLIVISVFILSIFGVLVWSAFHYSDKAATAESESRDVQELVDAANQPAEVAHLDIARACGTCMLRLA